MTTLPHTVTGPASESDDTPTILFLHGFMGDRMDWDEVVAALADAFRCVAVDLPGHGAAVDLDEAAYTFDGTIAALATTIDGLGIDRGHVVGYSMGGRLALGFALRHPERCDRLVLESASPGLRTETKRGERRRLDVERAKQIQSDFDDFLTRWAALPIFALKDEEARAAFIERRRRNRPDELARSLRGSGTGRQPSLWPDLARLAVPTLAVAGGRDVKFADLAFAIAAAAPTVTPRLLPAGHAVHAERPDLFAALVRHFLLDSSSHPTSS